MKPILTTVSAPEDRMMSWVAMQRLVWKDYRQLRGFWLSLLLLPLVVHAVIYATSLLGLIEVEPDSHRATLMGFALIIPFLFLLGSPAVLFAGEKENHTRELLAAWPLDEFTVFVSKCACIVGSTTLLALLLWSWNWILSGKDWLHGAPPTLLLYVGLLTLEAFCWSVYVALRSSNVVWAMFVSAAVVASICLLILLLRAIFAGASSVYSFIPGVLLLLVVIILDVRLGSHWLRGAVRKPVSYDEAIHVVRTPFSAHCLLRLLWQQWRQTWWLIPLVLLAGILQCAFLIYLETFVISTDGPETFQLTASIAALAGICAFINDRRHQNLAFFASHPVSPLLIWFSRHLVWLPITLLWALGMVFLENRLNQWNLEYVAANVTIALMCYSAAQLASFFCQSPVVGFGLGLIASIAATTWSILTYQSNVPLTQTTVPLIIAFLCTTALCSADRMLERHSLAARARAILPSAIALCFAILSARYRL